MKLTPPNQISQEFKAKSSDSEEKKSLLEEYEEALENSGNKLPEGAQEILDAIEGDEEFNQEIEELISELDKGNLDLSALQSRFLLLIRAALSKARKGNLAYLEHKLKATEKEILEQLTSLSHYIMMKKVDVVRESTEGLDAPKDKYAHLTSASIQYTKQILKKFAMYEIYKVMNPHRIAGETKRENFVNNYITGGLRKAIRFEGGSKKDMQSYSAKMLKSLDKAHRKFSR